MSPTQTSANRFCACGEASHSSSFWAAAGCLPILHMRDFQASKRLSDKLLKDITTRNAKK